MLRRILISTSILTVAASFSLASGCSSSSSGNPGTSSSSSGGTTEAGEDTSTGSSSGSVEEAGGDATGSSSSGSSSGAGSSSGSSGAGDAGGPNCLMPASSVPSTDIPTYTAPTAVAGACSGTDIQNYLTACEASTSTNTTCNTWFTSAPTACVSCLVPTTGSGDAAVPTNAGGLMLNAQGEILGANLAGCLSIKGGSSDTCAAAYWAADQCFVAAGCGTDPSATQMCSTTNVQSCEQTIFGSGGACNSYYGPYSSDCTADLQTDGGLGNGGACSGEADVLSVICGNGSGDGG